MSKGDTFENDLLKLIFQAVAIANIADNASISAATNLYVSLHGADPGEAGNQTTNETAYTNYARQAVGRSSAGFTVSAAIVRLAANLDFPTAASTVSAVTHFAIGTTGSGTGKILYSGTVTPNITVTTGVIPRLTTSGTITED